MYFKVGSSLLIDCSNLEVSCASSCIVYCLDKYNACYGTFKLLNGSISLDEIEASIEIAKPIAKNIIHQLDTFFDSKNETFKNDQEYPDIPPKRFGILA